MTVLGAGGPKGSLKSGEYNLYVLSPLSRISTTYEQPCKVEELTSSIEANINLGLGFRFFIG